MCFIATAVYGSDAAPEVIVLRRCRDRHLNTRSGRLAVSAYYAVSPPIARLLAERPELRQKAKIVLDRIVARIVRAERF